MINRLQVIILLSPAQYYLTSDAVSICYQLFYRYFYLCKCDLRTRSRYFFFILNSVYCTFRRFPHRLTFSAFKTLTWFISFTPFFDQIRTTELFTFLRCRLRSVSYLFKWYSYRIKPSTFYSLVITFFFLKWF